MLHKRFAVAMLLSALGAGCVPADYHSTGSFHNGGVIAEYHQTLRAGEDDTLDFRFYRAGTYQVHFSTTPGQPDTGGDLPQDFTRTITADQSELIVRQYQLPNFLRIAVTYNGRTESQDFQ